MYSVQYNPKDVTKWYRNHTYYTPTPPRCRLPVRLSPALPPVVPAARPDTSTVNEDAVLTLPGQKDHDNYNAYLTRGAKP